MTDLFAIEETAVRAVFAKVEAEDSDLAKAVLDAKVTARSNTGGGFFTDLLIEQAIDRSQFESVLDNEVWISVEGLEFGLGMILHLQYRSTLLLEGYAVGPEDTSIIDFASARFAVRDRPMPLHTNTAQ